ncbi:hypothetical protein ISCGN_002355 [Ixodes scapularis]
MADADRPPPNFLDKAGTPPIPLKTWLRMFERFILATGAHEFSAERRQAKLLNCLGVEGQRIFDSLPAPVGPTPATSSAGDGQQARQASRDVYVETLRVLKAEFSEPVNETLQQLRFHMRKQQGGESLCDFLSALRALAVPANFGADTEAVIRRQFMVGAASAETQERLVDGRHVTTGEVVFRDSFPHGVAGIVQADYCGDGREELIVCSVNGEVRGYLPTTAELRQQIVDATFEQDTVRELSQKKQMLQLEMRNYEGQAKTASGTPKGTTDQRYGTISAGTQLKTLLAINSGTADISPHVEVALKTNNETVIHAVMLFAEGIFSGESFVQ